MAEMNAGDLIHQLKTAAATLSTVNPYRDLMKLSVVAIRGLVSELVKAREQVAAAASACPACGSVHSAVNDGPAEPADGVSSDPVALEPGYGPGV